MTISASRPTKSSIAARVAQLPDTPFPELKRLWGQLFDVPLPTHNRSYVERRIAYRLQELEMAKKQPQLLTTNKMRIDALLVDCGSEYRKTLATVAGFCVPMCPNREIRRGHWLVHFIPPSVASLCWAVTVKQLHRPQTAGAEWLTMSLRWQRRDLADTRSSNWPL
ncbi:DUF2924 domain-containing protein (plasmid) [Ralstonia solanacearum P673]|uniref:DUF2924 domain-containing protein n=1 Tax=Ralstonia solanacearum TaxID=305 RepID=UPI002029F47D|nr:DUF2924 domain-containing protein [Ralstonia solanacearum]MCL9849318.1 DUF2924 domain-containing protein [Ralstonia solanacearum]MCL9856039.1 DUF2924 domain-containing protein [Ralstonia solanacearum]MCL9861522.1 DUF2924 domain-containing protein [Ralstonia solanacearum]MCL9865783.1 DUF2924 domain-containing protein [Ralstonia solanacearum]MCL9870553.1 DUF2924 domain-containing protein [Ralstonia solanacearum]